MRYDRTASSIDTAGARPARAIDPAIGDQLDGPIFLRPDGQRMDRLRQPDRPRWPR